MKFRRLGMAMVGLLAFGAFPVKVLAQNSAHPPETLARKCSRLYSDHAVRTINRGGSIYTITDRNSAYTIALYQGPCSSLPNAAQKIREARMFVTGALVDASAEVAADFGRSQAVAQPVAAPPRPAAAPVSALPRPPQATSAPQHRLPPGLGRVLLGGNFGRPPAPGTTIADSRSAPGGVTAFNRTGADMVAYVSYDLRGDDGAFQRGETNRLALKHQSCDGSCFMGHVSPDKHWTVTVTNIRWQAMR